ncbi:MAG TPA: hypothetical protein VFK03_00165, partial [Candidatus Saccharimonadales bacterium]|nr:hypothetical protein [Candidatus Saccharimonadales bacterium]
INSRLGLNLNAGEISQLLANVEISVDADGELNAQPPFWRTDIEIPEDIVEEIGRLYGFDKLPRELPKRSIKPAEQNQLMSLKTVIRQRLSRAGANEVLTYSFVHGGLIEKSGQDRGHAFELSNALSPDLQYYRLSLVPSLLAKVHMNIKAGYDKFALFELGKAHIAGMNDDEGLPREDDLTALVVTAADKLRLDDAPYYLAKRYLEDLIGVSVDYRPIPAEFDQFDIVKPYQSDRSAAIYVDDKFLGLIGEFKPAVRRALKLPNYTAGFELDTGALLGVLGDINYQPLPKFPGTWRDLTLQVGQETNYADIARLIDKTLASSQLLTKFELIDIYQADGSDTKNLTFRLHLTDSDRTITAEVANQLLDQIADQAKSRLRAEII